MPVDKGCGLQCDQIMVLTERENQGILWNFRKRRKDSGMDRNIGVCIGGHYQKTVENPAWSPHNFTNFELDSF